jgi:hypothetical protein
MHGQLPAFHRILGIAVELAEQRAQRVPTVERGARLAGALLGGVDLQPAMAADVAT